MKVTSLLALYGGPDQLMPLTSGLTAIFAFLLIFWNKSLLALSRVLDFFRSRMKSPLTGGEPPATADQGNIDKVTVQE